MTDPKKQIPSVSLTKPSKVSSFEEMEEDKQTKKTSSWALKASDEDVKKQVEEYDSMKPWQSYRGTSSLLLVLTFFVTILFSVFLDYARLDYLSFELILLFILIVMVYRGSVEALVVAAIYWTLSKVSFVISGEFILAQAIWWWIYISAFYKAWQVEDAKLKEKGVGDDMFGKLLIGTLLGILAGVLMFSFPSFYGKYAPPITSFSQTEKQYIKDNYNDWIREYIRSSSTELPLVIDDMTTLESMTLITPNLDIHYNYTVTGAGIENIKDPISFAQLKAFVIAEICTDDILLTIMDNKSEIRFIYSDDAGAELGRVVAEKSTCKSEQ